MPFISFPSWSETKDDLVFRDGLYYPKFSKVPFTGQVEGLLQGSIKSGLIEGSWVVYYENGDLQYKGEFKNGVSEGPYVAYWDNGQLHSAGDYKDGKMEGPWVSYRINGSVWKERTGTYKDGVKISD
jgi:antitoxin component YwqK of YwqJK toxin-antitoxin module